MKTDVQVLQESLAKYKDKTGKKAVSLQMRIESHLALRNLLIKYGDKIVEDLQHITIMDDPYMGPTNPKKLSNWFKRVFKKRLNKKGPTIYVKSRLHMADEVGKSCFTCKYFEEAFLSPCYKCESWNKWEIKS